MKQIMRSISQLIHTLFFSLIIGLLLFAACGRKAVEEPTEKILVQIGNRNISVDEFIRRAEYTVRPPYCRGNYNLDKKIIINSLIAEKLMSIEAGDQNEFITHDNIQAYLRGRKEQAMRQWLYEVEAHNKVQLDSVKIAQVFKVAGRRYDISYFNYPDAQLVSSMVDKMRSVGQSFEDVYFNVTHLDSVPRREVEWSAQEHDLILDSLFNKPLVKNQIVGPIRIADNQHMLIRVNGWIDRPAVTESQIVERWRNISDVYAEREAIRLYDDFIVKLMKGKTIEFVPDVFFQVTNLLGPVYIQTSGEKANLMQNDFWQMNRDEEKYQDAQNKMKALYDQPLFRVNDQTWSVQDFVNELAAHPLVFRRPDMKKNEFGQQLQLAIMDLVRDTHLNKIAYERGYDRINVVERIVHMWRDNLNYEYFKANYLKKVLPDTLAEMNYLPLIEDYLNPLVDSLQIKYSDQIQIDVDAFNDIRLTRIDMSVIQQNVPFAKIVPSFPLVTTDNALDYGGKMETADQ